MTDIQIEGGDGTYFVTVSDENGETRHRVQVKSDYARSLMNGGEDIEELLLRAFEFLLKRETKEMILPHFDLTAIERYFPEFEEEIKKQF